MGQGVLGGCRGGSASSLSLVLPANQAGGTLHLLEAGSGLSPGLGLGGLACRVLGAKDALQGSPWAVLDARAALGVGKSMRPAQAAGQWGGQGVPMPVSLPSLPSRPLLPARHEAGLPSGPQGQPGEDGVLLGCGLLPGHCHPVQQPAQGHPGLGEALQAPRPCLVGGRRACGTPEHPDMGRGGGGPARASLKHLSHGGPGWPRAPAHPLPAGTWSPSWRPS